MFTITVAGDSGETVTCDSPCVATDGVLAVTLSAGALSGTVTSSNETPLANGLVFLYRGVTLIRDTATDANGLYSLLVDNGDCDTDTHGANACIVRVQPPPTADGSATDQSTDSAAFDVYDNNDATTINVTMDAASS